MVPRKVDGRLVEQDPFWSMKSNNVFTQNQMRVRFQGTRRVNADWLLRAVKRFGQVPAEQITAGAFNIVASVCGCGPVVGVRPGQGLFPVRPCLDGGGMVHIPSVKQELWT